MSFSVASRIFWTERKSSLWKVRCFVLKISVKNCRLVKWMSLRKKIISKVKDYPVEPESLVENLAEDKQSVLNALDNVA